MSKRRKERERGERVKIGEILELTQHERLTKIAKERLTIGEKTAREALKAAGCYSISGKRGWRYEGDPDLLEYSIYDFVGKPKANVGTKEQKKDISNKQIDKGTDVQKNVVRKRSSFDIDAELLKKLKIQAILEERNIYEIVEESIKDYLKKVSP